MGLDCALLSNAMEAVCFHSSDFNCDAATKKAAEIGGLCTLENKADLFRCLLPRRIERS